MATAILPSSLAIPNRPFSSLRFLSGPDLPHLHLLSVDLVGAARRILCPPIRMGGGPRTFPGGVSKWQWKRMQAKKAKQLLKARLLRERQIYEMRKRSELKAAVSELERPWELVERAPNLFSTAADEQLKALADRFQRPGGFDMWSERDGPQVFRSPVDGIPSARFFPKGVVHSVKPYGVVDQGEEMTGFEDWIARGGGGTRRRRSRRGSDSSAVDVPPKGLVEGSSHGFDKDANFGPWNVEVRGLDEGSSHGFSKDLSFGSGDAGLLRNSSREELGGRGDRKYVEAEYSMKGGGDQSGNGRVLRNSGRQELNGTRGRRVSPQGNTRDSIEGSSHRFGKGARLGNWNSTPSRNSIREELSGIEGRRVSRGREELVHSYNGRDEVASRDRDIDRRRHGLKEGGIGLDADIIDNGKESKKTVGSNGYDGRNNRFKGGKVSLRPTTDLYSDEGDGSRTRESKGRSIGTGFRTNHGRR